VKTFICRWFPTRPRLTRLEQIVLGAIRENLHPALVLQWDRQVQTINRIQRLSEGVEVQFFRVSLDRSGLDDAIAFPNQTEVLLLGQVQVGLADVREMLVASVWCIKGVLFCIEYAGSVLRFEEAAGRRAGVELQVACRLKADMRCPGATWSITGPGHSL